MSDWINECYFGDYRDTLRVTTDTMFSPLAGANRKPNRTSFFLGFKHPKNVRRVNHQMLGRLTVSIFWPIGGKANETEISCRYCRADHDSVRGNFLLFVFELDSRSVVAFHSHLQTRPDSWIVAQSYQKLRHAHLLWVVVARVIKTGVTGDSATAPRATLNAFDLREAGEAA